MEHIRHQKSEPGLQQLKALCAAVRFLTVIPVSWNVEDDGDYFPASIYYFPLVGMLIGAGALGVVALGGIFFAPQVNAFFLIVFLSGISGFLHIDGLADSGDGLFSARPKEKSLQIMKDSRIGAMGVVLLVLVLIGKYSAFSTLPASFLPMAAMLIPLAGRCAILLSMAMNRYARPEGGIGGLFYSSRAKKAAFFGSTLLVVLSMLVASVSIMIVVMTMLTLTVIVFSRFCRKRIGGVTGDTLGAVCELTETTVAIALTAVV